MDKTIIVIYCSEDGDKSIYRYTKERFVKEIEEMVRNGESPVFAKAGELPDLDYFVGHIVIDGDIIEPKAKQVATKYDL